jgi:plasmid stabilization system protein ParE
MRKLHLSFAAAEDLENILQYTMEVWGNNQLEKYLSSFQRVFDLLQTNPENPIVINRDDLIPG